MTSHPFAKGETGKLASVISNNPCQSSGLRFPLEFKQSNFRVPGLGLQVPGTGYRVQVRVRGNIQVLNLNPNT
jgi:hypothetical protein